MKTGVFYQLPCAEFQSTPVRIQETIDQVVYADSLGFDNAWLAELHFQSEFSVMSAPLLIAAAIAQKTENIKIGNAVNLIPLHHPIRLAEEIATLDVISNGRAVFGAGRGSMPSHLEGFGINPDDTRHKFEESMEIILQSWSDSNVNYNGNFYDIVDVNVVPKPTQRPHPEIYIAANSQDSFEYASKFDYNILVTPMIISTDKVLDGLEFYRKHKSNKNVNGTSHDVTVNAPIYVYDKNDSDGLEPIKKSWSNYVNTLKKIYLSPAAKRASIKNAGIAKSLDRYNSIKFSDVHSEYSIFGTPQECADQIRRFKEKFDFQQLMGWFNIGGLLTDTQVRSSMRLFVEEVLPIIQE
jgi:alkanesulfonate monooxygenase SsuD/methylene tetrahydromethanopterin reductase-like flavin-dependent oxidoreductase (luciferase family)